MPEENFWTLWCKGRLTEADTPTIRLGATPSGLTSAHFHHPPIVLKKLNPRQQKQTTQEQNGKKHIKHTKANIDLKKTYTEINSKLQELLIRMCAYHCAQLLYTITVSGAHNNAWNITDTQILISPDSPFCGPRRIL